MVLQIYASTHDIPILRTSGHILNNSANITVDQQIGYYNHCLLRIIINYFVNLSDKHYKCCT